MDLENEDLTTRANFIMHVVKAFPRSYNRLMVSGWADYTRYVLRRLRAPDSQILVAVRNLLNALIQILKDHLERPELLRKFPEKYIQDVATLVERRAVALGLSALDDVTVADCVGDHVSLER